MFPIYTDGVIPSLAQYAYVTAEVTDGNTDSITLVLEATREGEETTGVMFITLENSFLGEVSEVEHIYASAMNPLHRIEGMDMFYVYSQESADSGNNDSELPAVVFIIYTTGKIEIYVNLSLPHLSSTNDPGYGVDGAWPLRETVSSLEDSMTRISLSIPDYVVSYVDLPDSLYGRPRDDLVVTLSERSSFSIIIDPDMYLDSFNPATLTLNYSSCDGDSLFCDHGVCSDSQSNTCSCDSEWKISTGTSVCSSRNASIADWNVYSQASNYKYTMKQLMKDSVYNEILLGKDSKLDIVIANSVDKRVFIRGELGSVVHVLSTGIFSDGAVNGPDFFQDIAVPYFSMNYDLYFLQYFSGYSFSQLSLVSTLTTHIPVGVIWTSMLPDSSSSSSDNPLIALKPPLSIPVSSVYESAKDTRAFYVQYYTSFVDSSTSGLGTMEVGLNLYDEDEKYMDQIIVLSGLMSDSAYATISSMSVSVDYDPRTTSLELFGYDTTDSDARAPGGHWFTILDPNSVIVVLFHMDYLGNVLMFMSLGMIEVIHVE
eukprot:gnl/Carplike_NY0171/8967_a12473_154.p1 GENE.gnl/Carplike_NY0171/8967_a12473_154~~gnl/Carplike_NY0171/8967_a12473_154.p1  ORF type:complete len:550 (+),score=132.10 gnl/Carplike_NY0171/8967_a12473_154:27-1652(+)